MLFYVIHLILYRYQINWYIYYYWAVYYTYANMLVLRRTRYRCSCKEWRDVRFERNRARNRI